MHFECETEVSSRSPTVYPFLSATNYTPVPNEYPGSGSSVSLCSQFSSASTGSSCSSRSSIYVHNPYSLQHPIVDITNPNGEMEQDTQDCNDQAFKGTMVLMTAENGAEIVKSKAEIVQSMRKSFGYVDSEIATPCGHFGRCRLRYKNSITHCRCRICGMKWREIAYSRIRPEQMEDFQRSFALSKTLCD